MSAPLTNINGQTRLHFWDLNPGDIIYIDDGYLPCKQIMGCPTIHPEFKSILIYADDSLSSRICYVDNIQEAMLRQPYWFYGETDFKIEKIALRSQNLISIGLERMKYEFPPELIAPPEASWIHEIDPFGYGFLRETITEIEAGDKLYVHFFDYKQRYHINLLEIIKFDIAEKIIEVRRTFDCQELETRSELIYLDCKYNTRVGSPMRLCYTPKLVLGSVVVSYFNVCGIQFLKAK